MDTRTWLYLHVCVCVCVQDGLTVGLVKKGATVIAVDKNVGNLKKTATLRPYELDITDWTALKKLYCDVLSKHGRIDIVVNNAGLFERTPPPPPFVTVPYSSLDCVG